MNPLRGAWRLPPPDGALYCGLVNSSPGVTLRSPTANVRRHSVALADAPR